VLLDGGHTVQPPVMVILSCAPPAGDTPLTLVSSFFRYSLFSKIDYVLGLVN
jgi:hypothetical protein